MSICFPSEDIVAREIEGDIVIIPLVAGIGNADDELYTLNESAQAIWKYLDGQRNVAEVLAALQVEYQVDPDELEKDLLGFIDEMVHLGILKALPS